jgi:hypothetical protein
LFVLVIEVASCSLLTFQSKLQAMAKLSLPEIKQQLDKLYTFDKGSNTGKSFCVFFDCQSRFQSQTFLIFL